MVPSALYNLVLMHEARCTLLTAGSFTLNVGLKLLTNAASQINAISNSLTFKKRLAKRLSLKRTVDHFTF